MECNLLHINSKKCCYMHFSPWKRKKCSDNNNNFLSINGKIINKVSETKFLGILIDDKLSWRPHILQLVKKLKSTCGRLYRIKNSLPSHLHKQIYHSLFESHLTYAISVWGGVSLNQIDDIFLTHKKCLRIMFGDAEAYLNKFRTCVRAREYKMQKLGKEFYESEPTKPICCEHELLTVQNLYRFRTIMELFKMIKFKEPAPLALLFKQSDHKLRRLITSFPSHNFIYRAACIWNSFLNCHNSELKHGFASDEKKIKSILKQSLIKAKNDSLKNWNTNNYTKFAAIKSS